jgi:hypothetical protein
MTERVYGGKYDSKLSSKEIAVLIRQDIKNAIAKGQLPKGLKVSVRYDHFSGGSSIDASVTAWPEDFMWLNPDWCVLNTEQPNQHHDRVPRYTKQAQNIIDKLTAIHGAYNHDGSDSMTDHFDVKYYGNVSVNWELDRPECERVYKRWRGVQTPSAHSAAQAETLTVSLGDEVTFTHGPVAGHRFIVINIGHSGPKNINGGLSLDLRSLPENNVLYADGDDLGYLKIVKRVPAGMRVVRFKH